MGSVLTDSNQDCSTKTNPQLEGTHLLETQSNTRLLILLILLILYLHTLSLIADKLQMHKRSQQMQDKAKLSERLCN